MAKRNFSASVEEALKGRDSKDNAGGTQEATEQVNNITTDMSETPKQKAEETEKTKNKDISDMTVINKNEETKSQIKIQKGIEENPLKNDEKKSSTKQVKKSKKPQAETKFIVTTWVPKELEEEFRAASTVYKNGAKYVQRLIEKDLAENGAKYKENAEVILSLLNE